MSGSDLQLLRAVAAGQVHLTAAERPISMPRAGSCWARRCPSDADAGAFAVESIRRASQTVTSNKAFGWWGEERQPQQSRTEPSPWEAMNPSGRAELLPRA